MSAFDPHRLSRKSTAMRRHFDLEESLEDLLVLGAKNKSDYQASQYEKQKEHLWNRLHNKTAPTSEYRIKDIEKMESRNSLSPDDVAWIAAFALADPVDKVRLKAIQTLGQVGGVNDKRVSDVLRLIQNSDGTLALAARDALETINQRRIRYASSSKGLQMLGLIGVALGLTAQGAFARPLPQIDWRALTSVVKPGMDEEAKLLLAVSRFLTAAGGRPVPGQIGFGGLEKRKTGFLSEYKVAA